MVLDHGPSLNGSRERVLLYFYLLESIVDMAHFNNVYVRFSPGPMRRIGLSDLGGNEHNIVKMGHIYD